MLNKEYASKALLRNAMISPLRARRVADLIRGNTLEAAFRQLSLMNKVKPARVFLKLLKSAMANAEQKNVSSLDRLFLKEVTVDDGPRINRYMPRAQGRADVHTSRMSHITIKLDEKKLEKKAKKAADAEGAEKPAKKAKKASTKKGSK